MPMGLGPRAGLLARAHLPGPRCPRPSKAVLLRRAALQATWGTSAGAHRPQLEAAEILCGSAALSRPGNDRPAPGGRAPWPEPGGGFQRGVRRRPLSAPVRSAFPEDSCWLPWGDANLPGQQSSLGVGVKVRCKGRWPLTKGLESCGDRNLTPT